MFQVTKNSNNRKYNYNFFIKFYAVCNVMMEG